MIHLRSVERQGTLPNNDRFPFTVFRAFPRLTFHSEVTFLVGENGSGKSTILEALACAVELPTVGTVQTQDDSSLAAVREMLPYLKLIWNKRVRRGFFMRSEDFFGYVKRLSQMQADMRQRLDAIEEEYTDRSDYAKGQARMAYMRELGSLRDAYGADGLDAYSHGESYFALFQSRFVPDGLYLLDEPEAPLSPSRQLTFISLMHMAIQRGAQFIIATHSPILMAYPGATIYECNGGTIQQVTYDEVEHVTLTRSFLQNPHSYLRHLIEADD